MLRHQSLRFLQPAGCRTSHMSVVRYMASTPSTGPQPGPDGAVSVQNGSQGRVPIARQAIDLQSCWQISRQQACLPSAVYSSWALEVRTC